MKFWIENIPATFSSSDKDKEWKNTLSLNISNNKDEKIINDKLIGFKIRKTIKINSLIL